MSNQTLDEFNRARSKMAGDVKTVVTDTGDLLKAAANVPGESLAIARGTLDEKLSRARARLAEASRPAIDKARHAATVTNGYVHDNPWSVIGVAAAAGVLIGMLIARR